MFLNKNGEEKKVVFLFPGNGIHQKGMLGKLSNVSTDIKSDLEEIAAITDKYTEVPLLDETVEEPAINQLRTVVSEIVICRFWEKCGLNGDIYIGHSLGEYASAYCTGVFSAEAMVKLLTARNDILAVSENKLKMCAFNCSAEDFDRIQSERKTTSEIAAYNSKNRITVVGEIKDIDILCTQLKSKDIDYFPIQVNGGGHSSMYLPYKGQFMKASGEVVFGNPLSDGRIISTVIPGAGAEDMCTKEYWFSHMTSPVRFSQAIRTAIKNNAGMFVDLGVSPNTLGIAMDNVKEHGIKWIPTVRVGQNYKKQMRNAFEQTACLGISLTDRFSK